jgi:hypothetical protein
MRLSEGVYPLLIPLPNPAILASIVESFDRRLHTNPHRSPVVNSTPAHANAATYVALHVYCLERVTSLEFDCDADGGVSRRRKWAR